MKTFQIKFSTIECSKVGACEESGSYCETMMADTFSQKLQKNKKSKEQLLAFIILAFDLFP